MNFHFPSLDQEKLFLPHSSSDVLMICLDLLHMICIQRGILFCLEFKNDCVLHMLDLNYDCRK